MRSITFASLVIYALILGISLFFGCKKIEEEKLVLNPQTKLPEENADLKNVVVRGDTLWFIYKAGTTKPKFNPGDIVVGQIGEGYLKKVISTATSGDTIILLTEQACLTDAIVNCDIETTFALVPSSMKMKVIETDTTFIGKDGKKYRMLVRSDTSTVLPSPEGMEFEIRFPNVRIEIRDEQNNLATYISCDTVVLRKSISFDLGARIKLSGIEEFHAIARSSDGLNFKGVRLGLELSIINKELALKLATIPLGKIVVIVPSPLGPLPVVFIFELGAYAGLEANLSLDMSCKILNNVSLSATNSIGAKYEDGSWSTVRSKTLDGTANFSFNPPASLNAKLQSFLKGSLDAKIYGFAGPSLYLKFYQYNEASYPPFDYELGIGLGAGLEFRVKILSWKLANFNLTFADFQKELIHSTTPTNNHPNTPSIPTGPNSGQVGISYDFSSSTIDPDGDSVAYQFDWGDENQSNWSDFVPSGTSVTMSKSWSSARTYSVKTRAKDNRGGISNWSEPHSIVITPPENQPPNTPSIPSGPSSGNINILYGFSSSVTDPDGDSIAIRFSWGDGDTSNWSSYAPSGSSVLMFHSWFLPGVYYVKAQARDAQSVSDWSATKLIVISDPRQGTLKWMYYTGGAVYSSPAIGSDGTIYFGSLDYYLYALNPNGTLKWRYLTGFWIESSPSIGSDGTIYCGSDDHYLYALNPNGTLKWRYLTGFWVESSPAIGSDGTIYFGSYDHYLYALNPNGTLKWRYLTGFEVPSSPAIGSDGTIYCGSRDYYIYALNPDGTLKWQYRTDYEVWSPPAIGSDGTIYCGSNDQYLYALNPDGTLKWQYRASHQITTSPAIGPDGTIYFGTYNSYLYALNPDGTLKWQYYAYVKVSSSPAIGFDGTIYFGSENRYLYALNPNGTLKWQSYAYGRVPSSPAIGSDGTIYFGNNELCLCAFYGSGPLANTPWPKFMHDLKNTGRVGE